jgi:uncharacterized protein (TIGR00730 family)
MEKIITVFGSSKPLPGDSEYENAYMLGKIFGQNNFSVCSGGYQGIMDAVSKGAVENGTEAIGITVDIFNAVSSSHLTKEIKCHSLFQRIEKLIEHGDAFVILPGGTGTLVELSIVWEMLNKNLANSKPVACVGNFWNDIIKIMDKRLIEEGRKAGLINCFETVHECADYIIKTISE